MSAGCRSSNSIDPYVHFTHHQAVARVRFTARRCLPTAVGMAPTSPEGPWFSRLDPVDCDSRAQLGFNRAAHPTAALPVVDGLRPCPGLV